jgi:pseudouridine kinase
MPEVIVIGGANVDIKGRSANKHVPGTSNPGAVSVSAGGVARNIAENLARLGLGVSLITVLSNDVHGDVIRRSCAALDIDLGMSIESAKPTGTYLAILDEHGEMVSAVNDMRGIAELSTADLERAESAMRAADMIVADCNIDCSCLIWLSGFSERHGKRLLIEPVSVAKSRKLLDAVRSSPVFAITPNAQQLAALSSEANLDDALRSLHALGFRNIVLHRGAQGAVASDGATIVDVPPINIADIMDVTGAGDAAVAGLIAGLAEGLTLGEAARWGQAAAAIKLSSRDSVSSALTRDRLLQFAQRTRGLP